ncbi:phosphatase PAP2 family protein [Aldersonia sp. NBC_00410]|uniref:phosphatase PAP2 family protein n=1 Tax=Aldersonia sp. NBC_00410 TaxID=2975954 RepID=UPI00224F3B77|nr:phosphatase PAP2 family protein [Aldersonia sp. NBC_00410]MCX5042627.1 phosphatase PAP2 family protein [Aldersonia sp. NBC_00410]
MTPPAPARDVVRWSSIGAIVLAGMFVALAVTVSALGRPTRADVATAEWFAEHRTPVVTSLMRAVSFLGNTPQAIVLTTVAVLLIWRFGRGVAPAAVLAGSVCVASLCSATTKLIVARERPPGELRLVRVRTHSFPSGHVTFTTVFVVGLLVVTAGAVTGAALWAARVLALVFVVLMAVSRMYVGVHWLTDVIGGALLGGAVALLGAVVLARVRARAPAGL